MFKKYYPYEYVKSVFTIDYQKLYDAGFRAIIFDLDNTLVHHGEDSTPEVDALFQTLHEMGFKTILLSNNGVSRIERFLKNIDCPYIPDADKPQPQNYRKALEILGVSKEQAVYIGDQVYADIYGANLCGIPSILVEFMRKPDEKKIGIRRRMEQVLLFFYRGSKKYQSRLGGIQKEEVPLG
jgi:HAD superfamily phosphatase (TIGR01668 family)